MTMTLIGFHFGVTLFLQIVTTLVIVGVYSAITSLRETRDDHESECRMVLLVSFLFDLHATVTDLKTLTGESQAAIDERGGKFLRFARALDQFRSDGSLPDCGPEVVSTVRDHVWAVFGAAIIAIGVPTLVWRESRYQLIKHTEYRKNLFSKILMLLAVNLVLTVGAFALMGRYPGGMAILLFGAGLVGVVACLVGLVFLTVQQNAWKMYWRDRLLELMAVAEHGKNHDVFTRAMALASHVDAQPDVPFPGRLALYTGIYSCVQAVILLAGRAFQLS
jgi:hypothetical protein